MTNKITQERLSNRITPFYFILKGDINVISEDSTLVDFLPFKDAGEAKKYAKKNGNDCFAVYASFFQYGQLKKYSKI